LLRFWRAGALFSFTDSVRGDTTIAYVEIDLLRVRFYVRGLHAARAMATLTAMLSVLVESFYPGLVASHKV
jgi:hypothetical protein